VLELISALATAVSDSKLALRLSPFGLNNETRGLERVETWTHLCREIKKSHNLSYIHFVEARSSPEEQAEVLKAWNLPTLDLAVFRDIMGDTPFISAGGWDSSNIWAVAEEQRYDALAFGRWFLSNPDLVERSVSHILSLMLL
jgi:2,4-dienoyl-CoA reductase-like NADH-dependent reductase (Old Yellow Enzyme family)